MKKKLEIVGNERKVYLDRENVVYLKTYAGEKLKQAYGKEAIFLFLIMGRVWNVEQRVVAEICDKGNKVWKSVCEENENEKN